MFKNGFDFAWCNHKLTKDKKQAGAELGQAQYKIG